MKTTVYLLQHATFDNSHECDTWSAMGFIITDNKLEFVSVQWQQKQFDLDDDGEYPYIPDDECCNWDKFDVYDHYDKFIGDDNTFMYNDNYADNDNYTYTNLDNDTDLCNQLLAEIQELETAGAKRKRFLNDHFVFVMA